MKITAEFSSNEELLSFINTFGAKTIQSTINLQTPKEIVKEMVTPKEQPVKSVEPTKEDNKKEPVQADPVPEENKENPKKDEETKVTKEMVRAIFSKLIQAGKAKEAKELTGKYGASKLPDLKEEDYAAVYKDAEGLI